MLDQFIVQFWSPSTLKNDALAYTAHASSNFRTFHSNVPHDVTHWPKSDQKRGSESIKNVSTHFQHFQFFTETSPMTSQIDQHPIKNKVPNRSNMWYKSGRHFGTNYVSTLAPFLEKYADNMLAYLGASCGHFGCMLDTVLPKLMQLSRVLVHVVLEWHTVLLPTSLRKPRGARR